MGPKGDIGPQVRSILKIINFIRNVLICNLIFRDVQVLKVLKARKEKWVSISSAQMVRKEKKVTLAKE